MIFMTGILWIYIEQAWHFFFSPLFFPLSLQCLWSAPAKQAFEVVKAQAFVSSPQSAYVTGRAELQGSNVTPLYGPKPPHSPSSTPLFPIFFPHAGFIPVLTSLCWASLCWVLAQRCSSGFEENTHTHIHCCHNSMLCLPWECNRVR